MAKWIFTLLMAFLSVFTFDIALNDQGPGLGTWMEFPVVILALLLALLSLHYWYKSYRQHRDGLSLFFCALPFILLVLNFLFYNRTQVKVNRPYFLMAHHPNAPERQFRYYFRGDRTLKTHALYFLSEGNDFQKFSMRGDTLMMDSILPGTGLESRVYLISTDTDSTGVVRKYLIPLNTDMKPDTSLIRMVVEEDLRK